MSENKEIITRNDLGIPYSTALNRAVVDAAMGTLGVRKLNALYAKSYADDGVTFVDNVLQNLGVKVTVAPENFADRIPEKGGFIVVANHPHGALDGLILANSIIRRRRDTKFLSNFLLEKVEPMREMFLSVNPYKSSATRNISGIRAARQHLAAGGGLIVFPAGEVSTYHRSVRAVTDAQWQESIMRFVRSAGVAVIPVHISGQNSRKFHFLVKIHQLFGTLRQVLELVNKVDYSVNLSIGGEVSTARQGELKDAKQYSDYLRANVYLLAHAQKGEAAAPPTAGAPIAAPVAAEAIEREINALPSANRLFTSGDYEMLYGLESDFPQLMQQVYREREVAFRDVGEGTQQSSDSDHFDKYYRHIVLWHRTRREVVGSYRAGFGGEIFAERGFEGFYTYTLFEYKPKFEHILRNSIELGRSFVAAHYQRQAKPLMLLWRAILMMLVRNPDYKYLLGPVSISSRYPAVSKALAMHFIRYHYFNHDLARMVVARNGAKEFQKVGIDETLVKNIGEINLVDKLICDLDAANEPLPILIKKYLQIGGRGLSFNVDPAFNNCLDVLILLDTADVPRRTLEMLSL